MQTVLITGIGRGIGKATAQKFLQEGWQVFGTSTTGLVDFNNENLHIFQLDLSKPESIAACVEALSDTGTTFDVLINNAGVLLDDDDTTLIPDKLRATLEVNTIGTADFTERMVPLMAEQSHIVFISSSAGSLEDAVHGISHYPGHYPAYKISKAALNMYMCTLARRLVKEGVTVSAIHPGWVKTAMGGEEASMEPEEAAEDIFAFANTRPETGLFWYKGQLMPW